VIVAVTQCRRQAGAIHYFRSQERFRLSTGAASVNISSRPDVAQAPEFSGVQSSLASPANPIHENSLPVCNVQGVFFMGVGTL
jgi:hypothetical protein